jgi:hypothetical protein
VQYAGIQKQAGTFAIFDANGGNNRMKCIV